MIPRKVLQNARSSDSRYGNYHEPIIVADAEPEHLKTDHCQNLQPTLEPEQVGVPVISSGHGAGGGGSAENHRGSVPLEPHITKATPILKITSQTKRVPAKSPRRSLPPSVSS